MDLKTWLRAQWDRVLGGVGVGVGLLALLLGFRGVADTPYPAEQIPFVVSGGVLGIALIGIGLTAWLSADLRDEWRKLDRIERLLAHRRDEAPNDIATKPEVADASRNGDIAVGHLSSPAPRR